MTRSPSVSVRRDRPQRQCATVESSILGTRWRRAWCGLPIVNLLILLLWTGVALPLARGQEEDALLPSGKGADLTMEVCGNCHNVEKFVGLRSSRREWEDLIVEMNNTNDAKITDDQAGIISGYLAEVFGPDSPPLVDANRARKEQLKKLPGLDDSLIDKLLDFRQQNGRFEDIEQIQEILGSEAFENVKGYLTVKRRPA